ncbi:MAG: hypothetical protein MUC88_05550 [Planctomycetes bacterium]|nr:hypothetical protein [Planctomycetota bacterium]
MTALRAEAARKDGKDKKVIKKDRAPEKATTGPTKVKKAPEAAVEAGKQDASAKAIKKKPAAQPDYDAIGRELKAAVQAGKLTKEEAKAKWEALKKEAAGDKDKN